MVAAGCLGLSADDTPLERRTGFGGATLVVARNRASTRLTPCATVWPTTLHAEFRIRRFRRRAQIENRLRNMALPDRTGFLTQRRQGAEQNLDFMATLRLCGFALRSFPAKAGRAGNICG